MMTLDEILEAKPQFHDAGARSWQASYDVLRFIDEHVRPGDRTLEVGARVSTVLFVTKGATHLAVVPYKDEAARIAQFCREHAIPLDDLTFEIGRSDERLPLLTVSDLDLVFIDGAHGFPMPFLDWHYTADRLKVGGLLIIDDTQLWTGHTLKCYLQQEPEWQTEVDYAPRSVVFRKVAPHASGKHERQQPYVMERTVDLLFSAYPTYVDDQRRWLPAALVAAKERSWAFRIYRMRRRLRAFLGRVLPRPIITALKLAMRKGGGSPSSRTRTRRAR